MKGGNERREGSWGGFSLMVHCLWELCETEYDRLSDFEGFGSVCVWRGSMCVCVHADEWLHVQRNMFVFFSLLIIGTVFSVIHICCTFAVHTKVIVFPLFKSFEN